MVDRADIERMIAEVEDEAGRMVAAAAAAMGPVVPGPAATTTTAAAAAAVVGREAEAKELVRLLVGGLARGRATPFVSVYGRSGSGKTTLVKFVCESLASCNSGRLAGHVAVNLRSARTVFGCACAILRELGGGKGPDAAAVTAAVPTTTTTAGAMDRVAHAVESLLARGGLFVLVLDEFDSVFADRRGRPSDFVYRLLDMQERLQQKGLLMSIVAISNRAVLSGHELDDRVQSRIGSAAEVPFAAYSTGDVARLLLATAAANDGSDTLAVAPGCDPGVIEHCAEICSDEHGDARRAFELFRVACQLARLRGDNRVTKAHVDEARDQLQEDRVRAALAGASRHARAACMALARISYLTGQEWHATSVIYGQYCIALGADSKPLTYRRLSEILRELADAGVAESSALSPPRGGISSSSGGYGTRYRLTLAPELMGKSCSPAPGWWEGIEKAKEQHDMEVRIAHRRRFEIAHKSAEDPSYAQSAAAIARSVDMQHRAWWEDFVWREGAG